MLKQDTSPPPVLPPLFGVTDVAIPVEEAQPPLAAAPLEAPHMLRIVLEDE